MIRETQNMNHRTLRFEQTPHGVWIEVGTQMWFIGNSELRESRTDL